MMTILLHNSCGFLTGYLKNIEENVRNILNIDLSELYKLNSSFSLQIIGISSDRISDEALFSVYENILKRGNPTFSSLFLEESLTRIPYIPLKITKRVESGSIEFINDPNERIDKKTASEWYNAVARSLVLIDPRIHNSERDNFDSNEERGFLLEKIPEHMGNYAIQLIEPQRKVQSISNKAFNFFEQRVDFCLEFPSKEGHRSCVIEIDGKQHSNDEQKLLDSKRDSILKKEGCSIWRITTEELLEKNLERLNEIKTKLQEEQYLKFAEINFNQPLWRNNTGKSALQFTLTPFIVARYQDVLLYLLKNEKLKLDDGIWNICVIERDIPFAYLGLIDLLEYITRLFNLLDRKIQIPRINLKVYYTSGFEDFYDFSDIKHNGIEYEREPISKISEEKDIFDIIIDCSILQRKYINDPNPADFDHVLEETGCFAIIRSNYHKISRGVISKNTPLKYKINSDTSPDLKFFLQNIFRKEDFVDGQIRILKRTLNRQDTIALLSTGGGKSLCYQLSALLQPGITIIIDPLRSLMLDQIENLKDFGIDVSEFISSDQTAEERGEIINNLVKGKYQFIFISPERLQIKEFRDKLKDLGHSYLISYVVIDEAHCVSEWGHDFRASYLNIGRISKEYCKYKNILPPLVALTGTASYAVLSDIIREIGITDNQAIISPTSFDRKELRFNVFKVPSAQKETQLNICIEETLTSFFNVPKEHILGQNEDGSFSGIVFCPHINGKYGVVKVAKALQNRFDILVKYYSGGLPRDFTEQEWRSEKIKIQKDFKRNKFPILVSTKAFGMGIDKPNIRYIIHYGIPQSLESFYQEAGRAGRDRKEALCIIIFSDDNYPDVRKRLNIESIDELYQLPNIPKDSEGDVHRILYFHLNSFGGIKTDTEKASKLLNGYIFPKLNDLLENEKIDILIPFNACYSQNDTEKAIYRLTILGVVKDYTVNYNTNNYNATIIKKKDDEYSKHLIEYVLRYRNPEYSNYVKGEIDHLEGNTIQKCIKFLIHFIYDEIEKKRRRSIQEMADAARNFSDERHFRNRLINYFDSKYNEKLAYITRTIDPADWWNLLGDVNDYDDIQHLLGGCSRTLESYPDHPGLLLLSCYARLFSTGLGYELALDDFTKSIREIRTNISDSNQQEQILLQYLDRVYKRGPDHVNKLLAILLRHGHYTNIAKFALELPNFENNHLMARLFFLREINNNLKTIDRQILN